MNIQMHTQDWIDSVAAGLQACCPDYWSAREPLLRHLLDDTRPVVTLAGPYDSGKSSLLKRILVDAGVPVPKWLTVSSRRETFETNEVVAHGAVFRDTPGVGGGNAEHESLALSSIPAADVLLIVVPPQLFTSGADTILTKLKRIAETAPVFPPGSLYFVVARMDEAGSDPEDNPADYQERVNRKLEEVRELLQANELDPTLVRIFAVVADPFQSVSGRVDVDPSEYDPSRGWDGIAHLVSSLRGDVMQRPTLRGASAVRFMISTILDALVLLDRRLAESREPRKFAENRFALLKAVLKQLDGLEIRAKQHLLEGVQADVAQLITGSVGSLEAVGAVAKRRLGSRFESWLNESQRALEQLLEPLEADWIQQPVTKPNFDNLSTPRNSVGDSGPDNSILRAFHKVLADDRNPVVRELKRDLAADVLRILGEGRSRHTRQQKWSKVGSRVAEVLVPLMVEIGRTAYEESQRDKQSVSTTDRNKLQSELFSAARDIALEGFEIWRGSLSEIRNRVNALLSELEQQTGSEALEEVQRGRDALQSHIDNVPVVALA